MRNALTENGSVARGVCEIKNGCLAKVTERTQIFKQGSDAVYTEDGEQYRIDLIQKAEGVYPPSEDLTLVRITQKFEVNT